MRSTLTHPAQPILHSFAYAVDYLRDQLADVTEQDRAAQPGSIDNHPAWIVGHLTFTCQMLGETIGLEPWLPGDWAARFGTGSVPTADAAHYESKADGLACLGDAQTRITAAILKLDDAALDAGFPDPSYRDVFPTIRHALTQVLVGHTSFHVGQVAEWRRAMKLPRMKRSFE